MAPLMVAAVIATAVFFAAVTVWQFGALQSRINQPATSPLAIAWNQHATAPSSFREQLELSTVQAKYSLEQESIARRYALANLTFESRLWTRFMGFVTGMILAMVGAAFVLGKLQTDASELGASSQGISVTIRSASPGIILAALGTLLMSISIFVEATVTTHDVAIYFSGAESQIGGGGADAPPLPDTIDSASPGSPDQPRRKNR